MHEQSKADRDTIPPSQEETEGLAWFEGKTRRSGEWAARRENLCRLIEARDPAT